jgi:hypothetical protein
MLKEAVQISNTLETVIETNMLEYVVAIYRIRIDATWT